MAENDSMKRRSEDRVLDEIDRLVDEELSAGPSGSYYCGSSAVYERCSRCSHEFHGLRCRWCSCEGIRPLKIEQRRDEPPRWLGERTGPARDGFTLVADLMAMREVLWDSRTPRWEITVGSDYRIPDDVRCNQCCRYLPNVTVPHNFRFDMLCQECALNRGMEVNPSAIAVVADPVERPVERVIDSSWTALGYLTDADSCRLEATQTDENTGDGTIPPEFASWFAAGGADE